MNPIKVIEKFLQTREGAKFAAAVAAADDQRRATMETKLADWNRRREIAMDKAQQEYQLAVRALELAEAEHERARRASIDAFYGRDRIANRFLVEKQQLDTEMAELKAEAVA